MPSIENGGNVMRPYTKIKFNLRVPPTLDSEKVNTLFNPQASKQLTQLLTENPPYGCKIDVENLEYGFGFCAPEYD